MNEFLQQVELALVGFPPVLKSIIVAGLGAISGSIILSIKNDKPVTTRLMLAQLFVGWMTGIFGGVLTSGAFTSQGLNNYLSGLGGYVVARNYLNGKEKEDPTKPPGDGTNV